MRTRLKSFLILFVLGISTLSYGQSITANGTIITAGEADIRSGGRTITITLAGDTWVAGVGTGGADDDNLLAGITCAPASGDWTTLIASASVSTPAAGVVTITLPSMSGFDITADITLSIAAPGSLFTSTDPYSDTDFATIAHIPPNITAGGTITTADEADIRSGSRTITITLAEDNWIAGIGTGGTDDDNLLAGITCLPASADWTALIASATVSAPAAGIVTITVPSMGGFDITSDIILSVNAPGTLFATTDPYSDTDFATIAHIPASITAGGTITTADEGDIRSGSRTIIVTLAEDDWVAGVGTGGTDDGNLLAGITSVPASADWTALIATASVSTPVAGVVTITVPSDGAFDITSDITLSITAPGTLFTSTSAHSDADFTTIAQLIPGITAGGTITTAEEGDIRTGGRTITVTLSEDDWVAGVGTSGTEDDNLLASITCLPTSADWTTLIATASVSPPASGVVTITLPSMSGFNITADITLSIAAPSSLFTSASAHSDADFAVVDRIYPYCTLSPASYTEAEVKSGVYITVTLHEVLFDDSSFDKDNFTLNQLPATVEIDEVIWLNDGGSDILEDSNSEIRLKLKVRNSTPKFNIDVNTSLSLDIDNTELEGSDNISSIAPDVMVLASIEPIIVDVSIPNSPMMIDDVVTVSIEVEDDDGGGFTLDHGTIGGRGLTNFGHDVGKFYTADMTIVEGSFNEYLAGENIPVDTIMLVNGGTSGVEYSGTIVGSNDPIDATRPVVDLLDFNNGTYHVGDVITAVIHATESGLTFDEDQTLINSVPLSASNVSSNESAGGIYQLFYTVADGNPDVVNPGPITATIVMNDAVGNENVAYSTISGDSPFIDANKPDISPLFVDSTGVKVPGDVIGITIVSGETGLQLGSGSHVNGVSTIGSGPGEIELFDRSDNTYTMFYTVGPDDDPVESNGLMAALITLVDPGGNDSTVVAISNNFVTIVTEQPVATIVGGGSLCPGDSIELFVNLIGQAPFELYISDGVEAPFIHISPTNSYSFYAKPLASDTYGYIITRVEDALGVVGTFSGTATVVMNDNPTLTIDDSRNTFQENSEPFDLLPIGTPPGGTYSGTGVVSSESKFYASVAGIPNSPHTIYYDYEDAVTGCASKESVLFSVVTAQANIDVPDIICYNDPATLVRASVVTGFSLVTGPIELFHISGKIIIPRPEGLQVLPGGYPDYSEVNILPDQLRGGTYSVRYTYFLSIPFLGLLIPYQISETFVLDEVPPVKFINPTEDEIASGYTVCKDQPIFELETTLDDPDELYSYVLRLGGDGITGSQALGYSYNPAITNFAGDNIDYEFTSADGCSRMRSFYIINYDVPDVDFTPQSICIPLDGGDITFTNTTTTADLVSEWRWEFGDVNSGVANTDTTDSKTDPTHDFTTPGPRLVSLEIETQNNCIVKRDTLINFGDKPIADFRWISDCFVANSDVDLVNESFSERAWESFTWNIYPEGGAIPDSIITTTNREDIVYEFPDQSNFNIELVAENDLNCTDTLNLLLKLKETYALTNVNYLEIFNLSDGKWSTSQDSLSSKNSWTYAEPDFDQFEQTAGDLAWYTALTPLDDKVDGEDYDERSWIQSPCFDLRGTDRPMIRMDIMRSFDQNRDGAVLQYTLDDGNEWITLGNITEGINWFNSFDIKEKPGGDDGSGNVGSSIGWSGGESFDPDTSWVTAAHDLDELIGEETVIFGIFYATDGASVVDNEGFAVDNIYIGERTKRALIEHFTNSADNNSDDADSEIDTFTDENALDVTNLQYHLHYPGDDPMNENNSAPASSRSFFYGISGIPYALMDGGVKPSYLYDFLQSAPGNDQLYELTLESPIFALDVRFQLHSERLVTTIDITALQDFDSAEVVLQVAVVEKEVSAYTGANGDTEFNNVVLSMLPSPAGTVYSKAWTRDDEESIQFSWTYGVVEDYEDLMVVAFIQDRESRKVLQVASEDVSENGLGTVSHLYKTLKVYPNPASNHLNVEFEEAKFGSVVLEITDMTGRTVMAYELYPGEQYIELDIEELYEGAYILQSKENGKVSSRTNFIKVR